MSVGAVMAACLTDARHGYYQRDEVFGARGDFVTAPEISQVFGELVGLWAAVVWQQMGAPDRVHLVELGPGRGTLMADALRAARVLPSFVRAARIGLVEVSRPLRAAQAERLGAATPHWFDTVGDALAAEADWPTIVIGNEFLDALPIEQVVRDGDIWRRRVVSVDGDGRLAFALGEAVPPPAFIKRRSGAQGDIVETRPAVDALVGVLAAHPAPMSALFIDYGHDVTCAGDTLQAVSRHAAADVLASAGVADLTAHVDFAALSRAAQSVGLSCDGPVSQAQFLGSLGAVERASRLMAARPDLAGDIETGVARLLASPGMGSRFLALGLRSPALPSLPALA